MPRLTDLIAHLTQVKTVIDVRRRDKTYALNDQGQLIALSYGEVEAEELTLGQEAACLEHLYVSRSKSLKQVRIEVPLPRLQNLYLNDTSLQDLVIPEGMAALEQLYVQNTPISHLHFQGDCPNLLLLDASKNRSLKSLDVRGGFGRLSYLYLTDCAQFEELLVAEEPTLQILSVAGTQIQSIPEQLFKGKVLEAFYAAGTAPHNVPKVYLGTDHNDDCLEEVRKWFQQDRSQPNKTVKLMLTGNGNVGKSSLLYALEHGSCPADKASTHGIQLHSFEQNDVVYACWDFGGQEIYHGTHRLFMTAESVQVVVFDPKSEKNAESGSPNPDRITGQMVYDHPFRYWFETARALSPDSQFVVVQNKKDEEKQSHNRIRSFTEKNDLHFSHVSAHTGVGIKGLQNDLSEFAQKLPDYHMMMPPSWLEVVDFLRKNIEQENVEIKTISKQALYQDVFKQNGVPEEVFPLLFKYLLHNGFLYSHEKLGDTIILDQRWALEALYKPLERGSIAYLELQKDYKGIIPVRKLFTWFGEAYQEEEKWLFLEFMESCGLCFRLNDDAEKQSLESRYVFPEFLDHHKPDDLVLKWQERAKKVVQFRYPLEWLNYFRIQSFIAAIGRKTKRSNIWRNGIHIETPEGWFMVELSVEEKAISLVVEENAMLAWLEKILDALKETNPTEGKWQWKRSQTFEDFDLEEWKKKPTPKSAYARNEGINDAKPLSEKLPDVSQKSIFFSYAWNDDGETKGGREELVNQLYDQLKTDGFDVQRDKNNLSYAGLITEFMKRIGKGDLVVVFLSKKYLFSSYCMWELAEVYRNNKQERDLFVRHILPIRVEEVNLDDHTLMGHVLNYWENKKSEEEQFVIKHIGSIGRASLDKFLRIRDVQRACGDLLGYFNDINAQTKEMLQENNFRTVKLEIINRLNDAKS